jgi:hypothetical protein
MSVYTAKNLWPFGGGGGWWWWWWWWWRWWLCGASYSCLWKFFVFSSYDFGGTGCSWSFLDAGLAHVEASRWRAISSQITWAPVLATARGGSAVHGTSPERCVTNSEFCCNLNYRSIHKELNPQPPRCIRRFTYFIRQIVVI